jgi:hypothetical protein
MALHFMFLKAVIKDLCYNDTSHATDHALAGKLFNTDSPLGIIDNCAFIKALGCFLEYTELRTHTGCAYSVRFWTCQYADTHSIPKIRADFCVKNTHRKCKIRITMCGKLGKI